MKKEPVKKKEQLKMGKVWADIEVFNSVDESNANAGKLSQKKVRRININALVDTGATMLMLPEKDIAALGLSVTRTANSRVADGRVIVRKIYGPVKIKFQQRTMQTEAVAIANDVPALLGQIPLEALDVLIDSKNQRLILNPASKNPDMAMIDLF